MANDCWVISELYSVPSEFYVTFRQWFSYIHSISYPHLPVMLFEFLNKLVNLAVHVLMETSLAILFRSRATTHCCLCYQRPYSFHSFRHHFVFRFLSSISRSSNLRVICHRQLVWDWGRGLQRARG